jgi:hypothetical protein
MRKLALFTLPFVFASGAAVAQMNPGFDNQTGHAQNAARLSGLHDPANGVHQMDTAGANPYTAPGGTGPITTATSPNANSTATAPSTTGGALPLAGSAGSQSGSGNASPQ